MFYKYIMLTTVAFFAHIHNWLKIYTFIPIEPDS